MTSPPYTDDALNALQAQRHALEIVFGPIAFQVALVMRRIGMLDLLAAPGARTGLSLAELCGQLSRPTYTVQLLAESALASGILYRLLGEVGAPERYRLTKTGFLLCRDPVTGILMDFVQDVCYQGVFDLGRALDSGVPEGLKRWGDWPSLYEALGSLPNPVQESWYRYDHYFSDRTFAQALKVVFDPSPPCLLDVGGNTGRWALACVAHDPDVEVTVVDLPGQIATLERMIAGVSGADRIHGTAADLLDPATSLPGGFEVIWMSQFLDCFRDDDIVRILRLAAAAMSKVTRLYINEIYWDRQRFESASYVLMQSSPYFTAVANGQSKFPRWPDMCRCIDAAGLAVEFNLDGLGVGHTLTCCRLAVPGAGAPGA